MKHLHQPFVNFPEIFHQVLLLIVFAISMTVVNLGLLAAAMVLKRAWSIAQLKKARHILWP